jgi:hypothetical protein
MSQAQAQPGQEAATAWGVMATFEGPDELLSAAAKVRDAGFRHFDVHTPYPVHGMDQAMGLGRSRLGWIVLASGLAGAAAGMWLQWYTQVVNYPLITGGKPYFMWQSFLVVTFEVMVLFAAFGALIGMLALNGLPQWYHPALKSDPFLRASDDGFFMIIEARDEKFDLQRTQEFLTGIGGSDIVVLEE